MKCPFCHKKAKYKNTYSGIYQYGTLYEYACYKCIDSKAISLLFGTGNSLVEWVIYVGYNGKVYTVHCNVLRNHVLVFKDDVRVLVLDNFNNLSSSLTPVNIDNKFASWMLFL
jgi:hypothetical protein